MTLNVAMCLISVSFLTDFKIDQLKTSKLKIVSCVKSAPVVKTLWIKQCTVSAVYRFLKVCREVLAASEGSQFDWTHDEVDTGHHLPSSPPQPHCWG